MRLWTWKQILMVNNHSKRKAALLKSSGFENPLKLKSLLIVLCVQIGLTGLLQTPPKTCTIRRWTFEHGCMWGGGRGWGSRQEVADEEVTSSGGIRHRLELPFLTFLLTTYGIQSLLGVGGNLFIWEISNWRDKWVIFTRPQTGSSCPLSPAAGRLVLDILCLLPFSVPPSPGTQASAGTDFFPCLKTGGSAL